MTAPRLAPPADELDDLTLARAQRGEPAACRALVQRYERRVFALLSRLAGHTATADLAQETFLRVFRALPAFDPTGTARLSTWILTIATRLAIDALRRREPPTAPLDDAAAVAAPHRTDEPLDRRRRLERLVAAVATLPDEQRAVFVLRELHDLDYHDIAAALDVELGTVKSRLARARAALRQALGEAP